MDNLDQNTINNIKNMVDSGNIDGAISQISPEMIQNFSKIFAQSQNSNKQNVKNDNSGSNNSNGNNSNFDFSNIDMNTVMKLASGFNNSNDPRSNLLNSLKPYLRDSKKGKLDNYINLMNMSKIADVLKNNQNSNKEN